MDWYICRANNRSKARWVFTLCVNEWEINVNIHFALHRAASLCLYTVLPCNLLLSRYICLWISVYFANQIYLMDWLYVSIKFNIYKKLLKCFILNRSLWSGLSILDSQWVRNQLLCLVENISVCRRKLILYLLEVRWIPLRPWHRQMSADLLVVSILLC